MATQTAVTISGSNASAVVALTGDSYVNAHAAMFQSMTAQLAGPGFDTLSGNLLFVQSNFGNVGVVGNASGTVNILVGDGTNLSYIGGSGNEQILAGNGNNQIFAGSGNDTIALGTGHNQIFLGNGNSLVDSNGSDTIQAGSGHDTVSVNGANATINGGFGGPAGSLTINEAGGTNTTVNVIDGTTINMASGASQTVNAFGDTTIQGGAGTSTTYNQQDGTLRFVGTGGMATVVGAPGSGNDTLYGASGSIITLTSSAHNNIFVANDPNVADSGPVTLNGALASGGNQFWAGSGNASLIGGTGGDTMIGGQGAATIMGGIGNSANLFGLFEAGSGSGTSLTIDNFGAVAGNRLVLFGFGPSAAAAALASETTATGPNGGVVLKLANNASITLAGVGPSILSTQNVIST